MASVYEKASKWYLRWKGPDGRWRDQVSTARSKTGARRLAGELERRAERQRLGLEPLPTDSSMTLGQLCDWWLRERCPKSSAYRERSRLRRHVMETALGALPLTAVTAARIEERQREMERAGLARSYLNGLRRVLHTVFARARRDGLWSGPNPIDEVEKRPEPKRAYVTLRADEVPLLLAAVPDAWRAVFAAALYTGLRKGELFGLRRATWTWTTGRSRCAGPTTARPRRAGTRTRSRSPRRSSRSSKRRSRARPANSCSPAATAGCALRKPIRRKCFALRSRAPAWSTTGSTPAAATSAAESPTASATQTASSAPARAAR